MENLEEYNKRLDQQLKELRKAHNKLFNIPEPPERKESIYRDEGGNVHIDFQAMKVNAELEAQEQKETFYNRLKEMNAKTQAKHDKDQALLNRLGEQLKQKREAEQAEKVELEKIKAIQEIEKRNGVDKREECLREGIRAMLRGETTEPPEKIETRLDKSYKNLVDKL